MDKLRIGINGFGRIGRCTFKILLEMNEVEIVGINDLADIGDLAYLLKYDSIHGWYPTKVSAQETSLVVDGRPIPFFARSNPVEIPWGELGADIVLECCGAFRARDKAGLHLESGAKKVIISAPSPDPDGMFVLGVNSDTYDPKKHTVVSMASCTTNCLAPVAKVLNEFFGVEHMMFTTVHAYTSSQALMDIPVRKRRRGRSAALSIVPTTSGAAKATERVLPELEGRITGMAMRVPVPDGSVTDAVVQLKKDATVEAVNGALQSAAEGSALKGILRVTDELLVSRDILGDSHSSIVDAESTMVMRDRVAKVIIWYDNEWGYSARLADFAKMMGERGL